MNKSHKEDNGQIEPNVNEVITLLLKEQAELTANEGTELNLMRQIFESFVEVFQGSAVIFLFSVLLFLLIPPEYNNGVIDIISESAGIKSFFATFVASIVSACTLFALYGPYISDGCEAAARKDYHKVNGEKFKSNSTKIDCLFDERREKSRQKYERLFLPVSQFNVSFGIGSVGVLATALIFTFFEGHEPISLQEFVSFFILLGAVVFAKLIPLAVTYRVMNEDAKKFIYPLRAYIFLVAFVLTYVGYNSLIDMLKNKTEETTNSEVACECVNNKGVGDL